MASLELIELFLPLCYHSQLILFYFLWVDMCVPTCTCVFKGPEEGGRIPQVGVTDIVVCLLWILGLQLRSSLRVYVLFLQPPESSFFFSAIIYDIISVINYFLWLYIAVFLSLSLSSLLPSVINFSFS